LLGFVAAGVGAAINLATTDAAAGEEATEAARMVVATVVLIDLGRAAELGGEFKGFQLLALHHLEGVVVHKWGAGNWLTN